MFYGWLLTKNALSFCPVFLARARFLKSRQEMRGGIMLAAALHIRCAVRPSRSQVGFIGFWALCKLKCLFYLPLLGIGVMDPTHPPNIAQGSSHLENYNTHVLTCSMGRFNIVVWACTRQTKRFFLTWDYTFIFLSRGHANISDLFCILHACIKLIADVLLSLWTLIVLCLPNLKQAYFPVLLK